jgi:hypothetical protein
MLDSGRRAFSSILDWDLASEGKKYIEAIKPEGVYFTVKDGQGTMSVVVNIPNEDKMVPMMEPLWPDGDTSVTCTPAKSFADLEEAG